MQHIAKLNELDMRVCQYKSLALQVEALAEKDDDPKYVAANNIEKSDKYGFMYSISGKRAEAAIACDKCNEAKKELISWLKNTTL